MSDVDISYGTALLQQAKEFISQRRYEDARIVLDRAPLWLRSVDPEIGNTLLVCYLHLQDTPGGVALSESVISVATKTGSHRILRQAQLRKSLFLIRLGRLSEAELCLRKSMEDLDLGVTSKFVASANNALGIVASTRGMWDIAIPYLNRALAQFQTLGNKHGVAAVNHNLGMVFRHRTKFTIAERYFRVASEYFQEQGIPHERVFSEAERSLAVLGVGDIKRADAMVRRSYKTCLELGNEELRGEVLKALGIVLMAEQEENEALEFLLEARVLAVTAGKSQLIAEIDEQIGIAYQLTGRDASAAEHLTAAARYYDGIGATWFVNRIQNLALAPAL